VSAKQNRVGTGGGPGTSVSEGVKDELETDFLLKRKYFKEKKNLKLC
jgi:hypothetical protein